MKPIPAACVLTLALAALAGCASPEAARAPVETRVVDGTFALGRARSDRGAELRFAGRLEERDGDTIACVAIAHNAHPVSKVAAAEMRVALRFHVGEETLDARLRFAAIHPDGPEVVGRLANCAPLGIAWRDRFGVAPVSLRFRTLTI